MNVVLIPGILGFGRIGPLHYFRHVAETLRSDLGAQVIETSTEPVGSIAARASLLERQIRAAFDTGRLDRAAPLHLVAHSMGGLDCQHLIATVADLRDCVATLACVGTPHHGTPLAGLLSPTDGLRPFFDLLVGRSLLLQELRQHTDAVHELKPAVVEVFNARYPLDARIRLINVVGQGRKSLGKTSWLLAPTHALLDNSAGPNDGVVPESSASGFGAGTPAATLYWAADHADLIGYDLNIEPDVRGAAFDHLSAYVDLVSSFHG